MATSANGGIAPSMNSRFPSGARKDAPRLGLLGALRRRILLPSAPALQSERGKESRQALVGVGICGGAQEGDPLDHVPILSCGIEAMGGTMRVRSPMGFNCEAREATVGSAAAIAAMIPAWRSTRVQPMAPLRTE